MSHEESSRIVEEVEEGWDQSSSEFEGGREVEESAVVRRLTELYVEFSSSLLPYLEYY